MEIDSLKLIHLSGFTAYSAVLLTLFWKVKTSNPCFWYIIFHWITGFGSILLSDMTSTVDLYYIFFFYISITLFSISSFIYFNKKNIITLYNNFYYKELIRERKNTIIVLSGIFVFTIFIVVIYYQAIGYNLFIDSTLGNISSNFQDLRLATYSGSSYFAPGYVNQFKNVLLPLIFVALAFIIRGKSKNSYWVFILIGGGFVLYALLGTGQRAFLVYSVISTVFGILLLKKIDVKKLILPFSLLVVIFVFYSILNNRIQEASFESIIFEIAGRMFINNQLGGIVGFRYFYEQETVWFSDWWNTTMGILPGVRGTDISHFIFKLIYGTDRGTAPPTFLGSAYYNGGVVGVIVVYILKGILYAYLYTRYLKKRKTLVRCLTYGYIFFYLSIFVNGSPVSLINNGIVTLFLVLIIRRLSFKN